MIPLWQGLTKGKSVDQGHISQEVLESNLGLSDSKPHSLSSTSNGCIPSHIFSFLASAHHQVWCVCVCACVHAHKHALKRVQLLAAPWTIYSPPGSSVHWISQVRILEWIVISSYRGSSQPRGRTSVSCIGRWILYH